MSKQKESNLGLLKRLGIKGEVTIMRNRPLPKEIKKFLDDFSERHEEALRRGEKWSRDSEVLYNA